jgi:light-regulated signal transduction histidine kinase (bacteriophytochrome)
MTQNKNILAEEGMRFFGKMSASATHEIKNTLAIINENAGLLEDLSMMSQNDSSLSPDRINGIAKKVIKNVNRADLVLQKVNRLSHSVDHTTQIVDLEEIVRFMLDMGSRLIEMQGVVVKVTSPVSPLLLDTNLFFLENVIWRAVETACHKAGGTKSIKISFGSDLSIPSIWFSMSRFPDSLENNLEENLMEELFELEENIALISYLGISIKKDIENNSFGLLWPKRI